MRIIAEALFRKELKRLAKKYPSIPNDYANLLQSLQNNPQQGAPLGSNAYKVRMLIGSKNTGKSGGARVITFLKIERDTLRLLTIYDKANTDTIPDAVLKKMIEDIEEED
jgi:mRNA-degrading endonuclease RelE of RelBE toxin-antitoxin system